MTARAGTAMTGGAAAAVVVAVALAVLDGSGSSETAGGERPLPVRSQEPRDGDSARRAEADARRPAVIARPPLRDCRSRAEGDLPPEAASQPGDVVVGPLAFAGLADKASRRALEPYRVGRVYFVKSGVLLRAGARATLAIGHPARAWVSLAYATRRLRSVADGHMAVRFHACPHDEPAFSYDGPVGIVTFFAGGFILNRPGCVPLEVRVAGRPPVRARVPLGVVRCDA